MKVFSLAVALALAVATVSAAECTDKQIEALGQGNDAALQKVCPSLYNDGKDALDPTNVDTFTPEMLKALSPCKEKTCLTELTKFVETTPDCTVVNLNVRATYQASVKLCEAFADGTATVEKAQEIFGDVLKNVTNAFESILNSGSLEEEGSVGGMMPPGKKENSSDSMPADTKPGAAAATPAPSKTEKSNAVISTIASVAVTSTVALVTSLML